MRWLADCSRESVAEALRVVAPQLADRPIEMPVRVGRDEPLWSSSTAIVDEQFIVKFAWSRPAALRLAHEISVLTVLAGSPFLPEVVAGSADPLLLITKRVPGTSLFEVVHSIDPDHAGGLLAEFLATLHDSASRIGHLPDASCGPQHPQVDSDRLRRWMRPDQHHIVAAWCEWADATLATPRPSVPVHADLHGDNQVWSHDKLRLVVDFETVSAAEPEYDFRAFPTAELLIATMGHYERITGRRLAVERVMAWHLRTALGDALWRSEAGIPLPDNRTPAAWIDDLSSRFQALGIDC
jgi:hypothetical protein